MSNIIKVDFKERRERYLKRLLREKRSERMVVIYQMIALIVLMFGLVLLFP